MSVAFQWHIRATLLRVKESAGSQGAALNLQLSGGGQGAALNLVAMRKTGVPLLRYS